MLLLEVESVGGSSQFHWPSDPGLAVMRVISNGMNEETPLMSALGDVMPKSRMLGEVADGLRDVFAARQQPFDSQLSDAQNRWLFGVASAEE